MLKYADQITEWVSKRYSCEICGDRDWEMVNGDAIITERRKDLEYRNKGRRPFDKRRAPGYEGVELLHIPFQIIEDDITQIPADAIIDLGIGVGTGGVNDNLPGRYLLQAEGKNVANVGPGDAVYTNALHLAAKYVIHTVPPKWIDGRHGERETLRACYANSLKLADELYCKSIAVPLITADSGFPKDEALQIALKEIKKFLANHDMEVILVAFDRKELELDPSLESDIQKLISERLELASKTHRESDTVVRNEGISEGYAIAVRKEETLDASGKGILARAQKNSFSPYMEDKLDIVMHQPKLTFQQRLFQLIDASGMNEVDVYNRANLDRRLFSRIRRNVDYRPKKTTAIALAVALELDMTTTLELMARAGLTLSPSDPFDLVIKYFITNRIYDSFAIDTVLFKYGLPTLGSDA